MKRLILRFLGLLSLALAIICGVMDMADSSGSAIMAFRPLGAHWLLLHESSLQSLNATLNANGPSRMWSGAVLPILSQPAIVVFGCLAGLFLALAWLLPRRRRRHEARYD